MGDKKLERACRDCDNYALEGYFPEGSSHGECRARLPNIGGWPQVSEEDWCAEFVPIGGGTTAAYTTSTAPENLEE